METGTEGVTCPTESNKRHPDAVRSSDWEDRADWAEYAAEEVQGKLWKLHIWRKTKGMYQEVQLKFFRRRIHGNKDKCMCSLSPPSTLVGDWECIIGREASLHMMGTLPKNGRLLSLS